MFCVVLLGLANVMLFVYMMLMMGFFGGLAGWHLFYLFQLSVLFTYYCAFPLGALGFWCAFGFSLAKQTERAALLSALSGGAVFSAFLIWMFFNF